MNTKLTCGSSLLPIYRMFLVCIPIILMIAPHALSLDHIYEVNIIYNHSTLNYSDLTVRPALPSMQLDNPTGQYLATVIAWNGTDLTKTRFGIPRIIFYDRFDPQTQQAISGGQIEIENTQITLRLPYFENAERIEISGPNITRKLVIPVSTFSKKAFSHPIHASRDKDPLERADQDRKNNERLPNQSRFHITHHLYIYTHTHPTHIPMAEAGHKMIQLSRLLLIILLLPLASAQANYHDTSFYLTSNPKTWDYSKVDWTALPIEAWNHIPTDKIKRYPRKRDQL